MFEGEYLNGKRWNGKVYNNYDIIEFEINNGNGKGKEYYENGKSKFEGEYLNGIRNGNVKEYYENGVLKFEGKYINGVKNGNAKQYYYNGELRFEGEYLDGKVIKQINGHKFFYIIENFSWN